LTALLSVLSRKLQRRYIATLVVQIGYALYGWANRKFSLWKGFI